MKAGAFVLGAFFSSAEVDDPEMGFRSDEEDETPARGFRSDEEDEIPELLVEGPEVSVVRAELDALLLPSSSIYYVS